MYPGDFNGGFWAFAGFGLSAGYDDAASTRSAYASGGYTYWTDFLFQAMFAATARRSFPAQSPSGSSSRLHDLSRRSSSPSSTRSRLLEVGRRLSRPRTAGFYDFAGSTLVHSVGGWGALVGAMMLGPRLGKYVKRALEPDSRQQHADGGRGCLPALARMVRIQRRLGAERRPGADLLHAGHYVSRRFGGRAGRDGDVVVSVLEAGPLDGPQWDPRGPGRHHRGRRHGFDSRCGTDRAGRGRVGRIFGDPVRPRSRIDDPVGAISVHLVCGVWGTLAVGIFSTNPEHSFGTQADRVSCRLRLSRPSRARSRSSES